MVVGRYSLGVNATALSSSGLRPSSLRSVSLTLVVASNEQARCGRIQGPSALVSARVEFPVHSRSECTGNEWPKKLARLRFAKHRPKADSEQANKLAAGWLAASFKATWAE